ncbi:hypothetical protein MMC16_004614 [Acarospora aff. strigata]|nr:hypothetical protein [Acarospora aff. strigata]
MATSTPPPVRSPLSSRTNTPPPRTPSPAYATAKSTQHRRLRRQVSFRTFHPNADSSETEASEHSSIFEAVYLPPGSDRVVSFHIAHAPGGRSPAPSEGDSNGSSATGTASPARDIWTGTQLETIIEQKSIATLRAVNSLPQLGSRSSSLTKPTPQPSAASLHLLARHKASFSLDDLPLRRKDAFKSSSDETTTFLPRVEEEYSYAYPQPKAPIADPPHRMPTPPGLPSFNTRAAHNYRIETPFRLRDFFSRNTNSTQTVGLPRGIVARGPNGVVRGRWRPSQSGHTGSMGSPGLAAHPFHNASVAKTMSQQVVLPVPAPDPAARPLQMQMREPRSARGRRQVRFAPSLSAAVTADIHDPLAIVDPRVEQTATELYHRALNSVPPPSTSALPRAPDAFSSGAPRVLPRSSSTRRAQHQNWQDIADRSKWEEFCERMCVVCCGVEKPSPGADQLPAALPILPYEYRLRRAGPGARARTGTGYAGVVHGGYVP